MSAISAATATVFVTRKISPSKSRINDKRVAMENEEQKEVEALCPECGHAFKQHIDRIINGGQKMPSNQDIECPVCGCGECRIGS